MRDMILIVLASTTAVCPRVSAGHTFTGRVERVIDGDTIIVGTNCVRLAEIDAPELKASYGQESRAALAHMILHKAVTVTWNRRGPYRRIIGHVYRGPRQINYEMVSQGWATQHQRYSRAPQLARAERSARKSLLGMWRSRSGR